MRLSIYISDLQSLLASGGARNDSRQWIADMMVSRRGRLFNLGNVHEVSMLTVRKPIDCVEIVVL